MKKLLAKCCAVSLAVVAACGCLAFTACGSEEEASIGKWVDGTYTTSDKAKTLNYTVFVPSSSGSDKDALPMVHWIGDATTSNIPVHEQIESAVHNGMAAEMITSEAVQSKHPSFVLVVQYEATGMENDPEGYGDNGYAFNDAQYTAEIVEYICSQYNIDTNKLYLTGQSAGCMAEFEINYRNPNLFAATYYVAGHWQLERVIGTLKQQTWTFTACENALTEYYLQGTLRDMLDDLNETYEVARVSAKAADAETSDAAIKTMLDKGNNHNFILFEAGTLKGTTNKTEPGQEVIAAHNNTWRSEPGAYTFLSVYDWLFAQTKSGNITTTYGTADELITHPDPSAVQSGGPGGR